MGFVHLILRKRVTHKINDGVFILSIKLPLSWLGNASFTTAFTCLWVKGEQAFVDDFKRLCMIAHLYKFSLIRGSSTSLTAAVTNDRKHYFLYQATLSINRRETCTLFFEEDLLQKVQQTSS